MSLKAKTRCAVVGGIALMNASFWVGAWALDGASMWMKVPIFVTATTVFMFGLAVGCWGFVYLKG